ncbi:metallophosphoesterase [Pseudaestuariivita atlantica]|uniref:Calcineurin-like phosphoesterase domain-containing protein n=1 Tax=Pseudaestuariivita atlantica TaxID=1317121 RepID=A0A0L1JVD6_9RHOB|nr:metallophosphoesterase [Pseudaestuariivita atlantica]KNG95358.1 hypothetical protein ATO11_01665 [Pseudaestuariivita atlantica]
MTILLWLGAVLLAIVIYAFWIEPAWRLKVVRYRVAPKVWAGRAPLRIVIISDLHAGGPHVPASRVRWIVRKALKLNGDVGVLLGDYAAAHRFTVGLLSKHDIIAALTEFRLPLGTYAVLGNHDWWQDQEAAEDRRLPDAADALAAHDFPLLENAAVPLRDGQDQFWLVGLADQRPLSLDPEEEGFDDIETAMSDVPEDAAAILLAHEPDIFPDVPDQVGLTLSGHTHGGQVRILWWSPAIMAAETETYSYGLYVSGDKSMIVSGGIGCSDAPVRMGVPPEITVVDVVSPDP